MGPARWIREGSEQENRGEGGVVRRAAAEEARPERGRAAEIQRRGGKEGREPAGEGTEAREAEMWMGAECEKE